MKSLTKDYDILYWDRSCPLETLNNFLAREDNKNPVVKHYNGSITVDRNGWKDLISPEETLYILKNKEDASEVEFLSSFQFNVLNQYYNNPLQLAVESYHIAFHEYNPENAVRLDFTDEEYEILKDGSRIYKEPIEKLIKNTVLDSLEDRHEDESLYDN